MIRKTIIVLLSLVSVGVCAAWVASYHGVAGCFLR